MHLHILGICGTFMAGIALIARTAGHRVTGCDANVYPPMSTQLAEQGIELIEGFGADQIGLAPDVWVVGNVVTRGNPLMEAVLDRGLRYTSGPQWLADNILQGKWVLAVAGTHGKTTTSSMLAWILEASGRRPGFLIGGVPANFGVSARLSDAPCFVIEADEYDTAFFDKRSKFVHYRPRTALLNNLEFDHADIFADLAAIETQFHHLVRTVPSQGRVLVPAGDAALGRVLARGCWAGRETFGPGGDWTCEPKGAGRFEMRHRDGASAEVNWALLGEHNRQNALAASAAAFHAGVTLSEAASALGSFTNVRRRLERRGVVRGVEVFDDFAHHPTAIEVTLAALLEQPASEPGGRVLAVLEPRSNTMKLGLMKDRLAPSLVRADRVFCFTEGLSWDARQALAPLGEKAVCDDRLDALIEAIAREARAGDRVLVMSNGGFGGIHGKLLVRLAQA